MGYSVLVAVALCSIWGMVQSDGVKEMSKMVEDIWPVLTCVLIAFACFIIGRLTAKK